jgi:hypothetical protein
MMKEEIVQLLDERLTEEGIGDCDGSEMGEGVVILFCFVEELKPGIKFIKKVLKEYPYFKNAKLESSGNTIYVHQK